MIVDLHIVLVSILGFFTTYLLFLSILAFFSSLKSSFSARTQLRFSIVVPAHNEELSLRKTLTSLLEIDYPTSLFDIIVVADNCADSTATIAIEAGVLVLERTDERNRGKGFALRWCFEKILKDNRYDAVIVIDADSVASSNYLSVMNYYLASGAKVIQSSDLVSPQPGVWSAEATRLGFYLYNYVRPLGRKVIGCSAGLRGNGMCFSTEVLRKVPWEAYSRAEDLEYGLQLMLCGYHIQFAPEAKVLATMPANPDNAQSQRARWEGGRFELIKKFLPSLLSRAFREGSPAHLDAAVDLAMPALVNMLLVAGLMILVSLLLYFAGVSSIGFAVAWSLVFLAGILHMFIGVFAGGDRDLLKLMVHIPRYIVWKLALYLRLVSKRRNREWVRTTREGVEQKAVEPSATILDKN